MLLIFSVLLTFPAPDVRGRRRVRRSTHTRRERSTFRWEHVLSRLLSLSLSLPCPFRNRTPMRSEWEMGGSLCLIFLFNTRNTTAPFLFFVSTWTKPTGIPSTANLSDNSQDLIRRVVVCVCVCVCRGIIASLALLSLVPRDRWLCASRSSSSSFPFPSRRLFTRLSDLQHLFITLQSDLFRSGTLSGNRPHRSLRWIVCKKDVKKKKSGWKSEAMLFSVYLIFPFFAGRRQRSIWGARLKRLCPCPRAAAEEEDREGKKHHLNREWLSRLDWLARAPARVQTTVHSMNPLSCCMKTE